MQLNLTCSLPDLRLFELRSVIGDADERADGDGLVALQPERAIPEK